MSATQSLSKSTRYRKQSHSRIFSRRRRPMLEFLEDRIALAYTATTTGAFVGDSAGDTITFSQVGGLLTHNRAGDGGFVSQFDFDSDTSGEQVLAASASTAISVNTGGGNDTVNIGTATVAASTLFAAFNITNSGQDGDTLVVDDSASTTGKTYNETSVAITATGILVNRAGNGYSGGVELRTSSGDDTVNLLSVATVGTFVEPVRFITGGGADTINIDPTSNSLDTFGQLITVNGGTGDADSLTLNDSVDADSNVYTVNATSVQRTGGIVINYSNIDSLSLDAGNNADALTLDYSSGALTSAINYTAGTGIDSLALNNGTFGIFTHTYTNATDGTAQINGQPLISYTGNDSIADNLNITGRIFNFSNSNDVVTVGNDAGGLINLSQISSASTSPLTTFTNPGSLTIQLDSGGAGNDSLTINAFEPTFNANVLVNAGDGNDDLLLNATAGTSNAYNLNGDAGNDSLTLDYTLSAVNRLINFNGGSGGLDSMTLRNGAVISVTHTFANATDGSILVNANPPIQYTGLDPISDQLTATTRTFTFGTGPNIITLSDDTGAVAGMSQISSASTSETVTFANPSGTLTINTGNNGDTVTIRPLEVGFSADIDVNGGDGADTIVLANGASLFGGGIDGGDGVDTIDYSNFTTPVAVNLGSNVASLIATLQGDQEVPANSSTATGVATITYNNTAHTIDIVLTVSGIAPTDTGLRFHVHRAPTGVNGPIIVDLFNTSPPSSLGTLTPTGPTSFTFTATNIPLDPLHEAALLGGITYFNVHTAAFPGGEIRGQLFPSALFIAAQGTATGTGGVSNIENATGGAGSFAVGAATFGDSLVGDGGANLLRGGPGNDVLVGGRGGDTIEGGASIRLLGLTGGNSLVSFNADDPGTILATTPITGLASGENVVGIDVRPLTGQLYGVTNQSRLIIIDPVSGAATLVASLTNSVGGGAITLSGTAFGMDFNPVVDRLRLVSDTDQNLRINPTNGVTIVDGTLIYDNTTADGDPIDSNAGANPEIGGVAYLNSFAGATSTTLFDIDTALDILTTQNPPNDGVLNTVGSLGVTTPDLIGINSSDLAGFDILGTNNGFLSLVPTGAARSSLYQINLTTGAVTLVGAIETARLRGLTAASVGNVGPVGSVLEDDDILVWSNGDGSDIMDGGPRADLVNVNGNPTGDDAFTVGAGPGGRVDFDRIIAGEFSLDIGTTETLSVNGIGGNDTFSVNSLAGVNDLTAVSLKGLDGNETFNVTPAADVTVNVAGHQPRTAPGDTLNYNGSGNVSSSDPGAGSITQAGIQNVNFTGIEDVNTTITVTVQNGQLIVGGSNDDDIVTITGIPAGVPGTGMYEVTTQQGSQLPQTQTVSGVTGDIRVNLRAGNDQLTMNNAFVNGAIVIEMENGNDTVTLGNLDVVSTAQDLAVNLGAGNDVLDGKRIFIGRDQLLVGGDGDDSFTFDGIESPFTLGTSAAGNANWLTGDGNDTVHVVYAFIRGAFAIDLGGGTDSLDIFGSAVSGNVVFLGGVGSDSLTIDTNFFDAAILLDTGADNDTIFLANGLGTDLGTINTGAGDDSVTVRNETQGRTDIDTGSGDDTVDVQSSAVDQFFAVLGDDDDELTLFGNLVQIEADLDGGAGSADRLIDLGNDVRGELRTRNFELFG